MFYRVLLFSALLVFAFTVFSQLAGKGEGFEALYNAAEKLYSSESATPASDSAALLKYNAVINILAKKQLNDSLLLDSYIKSGFILTGFENDSAALNRFLAAVALNANSTSLHDSLSFIPWLFAGNSYYNLFNPDSALYCYKQAETLLTLYPNLTDGERLYNKAGVLYYESGDYNKSISYFSKALSLLDTANKANAFFIVNYKNNIASAYRKLRAYDKALAIYTSLLQFGFYRNELLHNIGVTYLDEGNAPEAVKYLQKASYNSNAKYNDLARAYIQLKNVDSAESNVTQAAKSYENKVLQRGPDYANALKLTGDICMLKLQPGNALQMYQKSILATATGFTDSLPSKNPAVFTGLNQSYFLFDVITAKARAYQALQKLAPGNLSSAQNAFSAYQSALALAAYMEKGFGTDESKLFLKKNVEEVYKSAVETGLQLYEQTKDTAYLNRVFEDVEGSKASVLQTNMHDIELGSIKGMPVKLLAEEKGLKARLNNLELQLNQRNNSTELGLLQQQVQETAIKLSHIQEQLNENDNYRRLKYASTGLHVSDIQQRVLDKTTAVLSYYLAGGNLVCFYVLKQQFGYVKLAIAGNVLANNITALNTQLHLQDAADNKQIANISALLYKQLITPVEDRLSGISKLIIIPHNELSYVPFEMLGTDDDLVIKKYAVSYQYSTNFLNTAGSAASTYSVLAMAPFVHASQQSTLPALAASGMEIQGLPGKALIDSAATKASFLQNATGYPVIHLATHAAANDSLPLNSYINFYLANPSTTSRLYEPEIYQLNLSNTRLAILSACETGTGQLINSEGLISLSRAFSYAGCRSVITSLWKANDVATAFICGRLHRYLEKGYTIDEALQKAKLDYLESNEVEQRYKKPVYWANLIVMGDAHAITKKYNYWYLLGIAIAVAIITAMVVAKKTALFKK